MQINAIATQMSSMDCNSLVSAKIMKMSLDQMETTGDGMKKMMEMSVNPSVGGNIDVSV